jgi:hypothetical protein
LFDVLWQVERCLRGRLASGGPLPQVILLAQKDGSTLLTWAWRWQVQLLVQSERLETVASVLALALYDLKAPVFEQLMAMLDVAEGGAGEADSGGSDGGSDGDEDEDEEDDDDETGEESWDEEDGEEEDDDRDLA